MKSTNFCEILSLLYGILIHETDNNNNNNNQTITDNNNTITVHEKTFVIVINSMILLNTLAILDLDTFQVRTELWNFYFKEFILILDNTW
jgi:ABC-type Fe3+-citrate transport system substrate-binding protein